MKEEVYNIYNIISIGLINKTNNLNLFKRFNPEYKFFRSEKICSNHINIVIGEKNKEDCNKKLQNGKSFWTVGIKELEKNNKFIICPVTLGFRKIISFITLKNLYVRSVLMDKLLNSSSALIHSAAFSINGQTAILAGRPGVFKTSILMDAIRDFGAAFIGEENCMIYNNKVYPFPLNIDSIAYKINNYRDENPSGKFQKLKLGFHLLKGNSKNHNLNLAKPSEINTLLFLEKGNEFRIRATTFEELLPKMIKNELDELSIPPTHSLSGINYNYFLESMVELDPDYMSLFKSRLEVVFRDNFQNCSFNLVTSPKVYTKEITSKIVKVINNE